MQHSTSGITDNTAPTAHEITSMVADYYSNNGGTVLQKIEKPKTPASSQLATSSAAEPTTGREKKGQTISSLCAGVDGCGTYYANHYNRIHGSLIGACFLC
jgi:hypothetical protein